MTKEQIIGALKAAAKPYEEYYIDDEVVDAINTYSNPYELVEPILEIIADNPSVDFGMPGELVHFVEQVYKNGYEELLIASVSEKPTPHNIWMLHRCYNDINNPQRDKFAEVIRELKNEESVSVEIKDKKIVAINVLNVEADDEAFFNRAKEGVTASIIAKQRTDVDTVSGAT